MASIFNSSSLELMALSPRELALKIRSEGCIFDLPPLVQVLLQKLEENDPEDLDKALEVSSDKAEEVQNKIDEIGDQLDHAIAFFDGIVEESVDDDEDETTHFSIKKEDFFEFQNILEEVHADLVDLNPNEIVPEL